jgi:hypothetical protein
MSDFGIGDVLLAAANGALQKYGADRDEEKQKDEAAAASAAKEAFERRMKAFGASLETPKYQSYEATVDGQRGKRTVRSHYDAGAGKVVEDDLGFAPDAPKAPTTRNVINGQNESTQQFNEKTGQWEDIGAPGPRFAPHEAAAGADRITFEQYQDMTPEQQATYRAYKAPGAAGGPSEEDKADKAARSATAVALRDFNKMSRYEKIDALKSVGIDPGIQDGDTKTPISADALERYRNTLRDDNLTLMGAPLFKHTNSGAQSTAPKSAPLLSSASALDSSNPDALKPVGGSPGIPSLQQLLDDATKANASGADPAVTKAGLAKALRKFGYPAQLADAVQNDNGVPSAPTSSNKAPYPEGARLKGRDGRTYVVKNGKPVLVE